MNLLKKPKITCTFCNKEIDTKDISIIDDKAETITCSSCLFTDTGLLKKLIRVIWFYKKDRSKHSSILNRASQFL